MNSRIILHVVPGNGMSASDQAQPLLSQHREGGEHQGSYRSLVVQGPRHYQGTVHQITTLINSRIKPLEVEPRMFLRSKIATNADGTEAIESESVELVVTTIYRDDVQIQNQNGDDPSLLLNIMAQVNAETFFLYMAHIPGHLTPHLGKALSNHPTLKRLWVVTSSQAPTDSIYSIAASIIACDNSPIRELIVEGYRSEEDAVLSQNQQRLFAALEKTSHLRAVAFVKTAFLNSATLSRLGQALSTNCSVAKLYLGSLDNAQDEGIEAFARCIPNMKHLQVLDIRQVHRLVFTRPDQQRHTQNDASSFEPIIRGLEGNWSIAKIQGSRRYTKDLSPFLQNLLDYQLKLNRSCAKQFVKRPTTLPNVWAFALYRCNDNPTAMFYCLREKVASACT